ncbi:hypothetical protein SNEBB_002025 [Seison nebaliae]|nr:hypothetical protein SNEBB_002025 [Seison nebaliae]
MKALKIKKRKGPTFPHMTATVGWLNYNQIQEKPDVTFKILVLGEKNVGKTSVISSLFTPIDELKTLPTCGADFVNKYYVFRNELKICLQIWDFAGEKSFHSLNRQYFRNWDACIHLFDASNFKTLDIISDLLEITEEEFGKKRTHKKGFHFLLANKIDLVDDETKEFFDNANSPSLDSGKLKKDWEKVKRLLIRECLYLMNCSAFDQNSARNIPKKCLKGQPEIICDSHIIQLNKLNGRDSSLVHKKFHQSDSVLMQHSTAFHRNEIERKSLRNDERIRKLVKSSKMHNIDHGQLLKLDEKQRRKGPAPKVTSRMKFESSKRSLLSITEEGWSKLQEKHIVEPKRRYYKSNKMVEDPLAYLNIDSYEIESLPESEYNSESDDNCTSNSFQTTRDIDRNVSTQESDTYQTVFRLNENNSIAQEDGTDDETTSCFYGDYMQIGDKTATKKLNNQSVIGENFKRYSICEPKINFNQDKIPVSFHNNDYEDHYSYVNTHMVNSNGNDVNYKEDEQVGNNNYTTERTNTIPNSILKNEREICQKNENGKCGKMNHLEKKMMCDGINQDSDSNYYGRFCSNKQYRFHKNGNCNGRRFNRTSLNLKAMNPSTEDSVFNSQIELNRRYSQLKEIFSDSYVNWAKMDEMFVKNSFYPDNCFCSK